MTKIFSKFPEAVIFLAPVPVSMTIGIGNSFLLMAAKEKNEKLSQPWSSTRKSATHFAYVQAAH